METNETKLLEYIKTLTSKELKEKFEFLFKCSEVISKKGDGENA